MQALPTLFMITIMTDYKRLLNIMFCLNNLSENSVDPLKLISDKYNYNHKRKPSHGQFLQNIIEADLRLCLLEDCLLYRNKNERATLWALWCEFPF